MDAIQAIQARRSVPRVKTDPVPRAWIEKLLQAAVQAPNHYKVRPWRFVVLTGLALDELGDVMAQSFQLKNPATPAEGLAKTRGLPRRAPLIIAVGVDKPTDARALEIENICAAAAACENILIAAQDLGLGVQWRTGDWARDPRVKEFLGMEPDQPIVAFLYIGYPELPPEPYDRPGFEDRTVWRT